MAPPLETPPVVAPDAPPSSVSAPEQAPRAEAENKHVVIRIRRMRNLREG
jgi:hypothetical protein